ncbi:MAG: hypothetical protein KF724_01575 [Phycisphaeraceae bacterium]|nr:hypothetical protein [Phycisphaeraceae bacterium]
MTQHPQVSSNDTVPAPLSVSDAGRVFWWKGRLFRGIPTEHAAAFQHLFNCGLVKALVDRGLLVPSWISEIKFEGFALVIEHEVIATPLFPKEWSFSMLKDAALLVLELNEVAATFGYQTKDCHGYNILFRHGRPLFVDLGSLARMEGAGPVLFSYHEFMRTYGYPLLIWRSGGQHFGQRAMPRVGFMLSAANYLKFRWPWLRRASDDRLTRMVQKIHALRTLPYRNLEELAPRFRGWRMGLIRAAARRGLFSRPATIARLRRWVNGLREPDHVSLWSHYQSGMHAPDGRAVTPRFEHIARRIEELGVTSVMEIAANQGALARRLAAGGVVRSIIATDADGAAIDKGYCAARGRGLPIDWAIFNPFSFERSPLEPDPEVRFRADAVVVMALTHHLILTQSLGLRYILTVLGWFTSRYAFIEFMPLGLHDGTQGVATPPWYTEAWFREEFERHFEVVERTQLEPNRVLFVGRIRGHGS